MGFQPCFRHHLLLQYSTVCNKRWEEPGNGARSSTYRSDIITCTLRIGSLHPEINMKLWEIVLLTIAACFTVIGLVIWIPVAVCCKCVASINYGF